MTILNRKLWTVAMAAAIAAGCGGDADEPAEGALAGAVQVDGSSTVFPITEAVAEEFTAETGGDVRVTVGTSGTGGGFQRFCTGETDLSNASRPIKAEEQALCERNGIEPIQIPVAYDGIAVMVNPANTFVDCLTVEELKKIWEPGSGVQSWADVRAGWPAEPIKLYGPGTQSGTFDYFTDEIVGEEGASRPDYTASEDDNVLVQGIAGDPSALGYFGYAYYEENADKLKLVPINGGAGCVTPSPGTIADGSYVPLSRPIFVYGSEKSFARPEVAAFMRFYIEQAPTLVPEVGYVPLEPARYQEALQKVPAADAAAES